MEKIQNQKHPKEILYYAVSIMLERASYYGFRALIVLYMVGEALKMERTQALSIYGIFVGSFVFSKILGALLGDLLIGNKKSIIIGAIIQAIGVFCLWAPSINGLYLGLFLILLGSGFYTPNIISNFGKTYLNKSKLLDSGFMIFYLILNLGAFLGILLIGYLGEKYGYRIGFLFAGVLMLLSIIPILFTKEKRRNEFEKNQFSIGKRISSAVVVLIVVALFWGFYELAANRTYQIQLHLSLLTTLDLPLDFWQSINSIPIFPIGIIAVFLWTYFYSSHSFKLMLGFIFGAISFVVLFLIPESPTEEHALIYLSSLVFLAISEILIAPIVYSVLTRYINPKYLAILVSLAFVPTRTISFIIGLFDDKMYDKPMFGLQIGVVGMMIIGIGLIGYILTNKLINIKARQ